MHPGIRAFQNLALALEYFLTEMVRSSQHLVMVSRTVYEFEDCVYEQSPPPRLTIPDNFSSDYLPKSEIETQLLFGQKLEGEMLPFLISRAPSKIKNA